MEQKDVSEKSNNTLQLGDVIRIKAPGSTLDIHDKTFLITYISNRKLVLNSETGEIITIPVVDGKLEEKNISGIEILSRSDEKGYARQNGLLPGSWLNVHFGGDVPAIFTGKITDIEQDMIELTLFPNNEKIYLDFKYQGLPEDIPIEKIILRDQPEKISKPPASSEDEDTSPPKENEDVEAPMETVPVEEVKAQLREIILEADAIQLGKSLEAVDQIVEIPEDQQRFGIDKQTSDMLDELLSTIPNSERTRSVMNNLHRLIERFKQLREAFSQFDENGNAMLPKTVGAGHKPLVHSLLNLNKSLLWLLPIVKSKKKLYNVDISPDDEQADIVATTLAERQMEIAAVFQRYIENDIPDGESKLAFLMSNLQQYMTPFDSPNNTDQCLFNKTVHDNIEGVVDTLEDFYSSVAKGDVVRRKRFLIQKYDLGLTSTSYQDQKDGLSKPITSKVTNNDKMCVTGVLMLPEPVIRFSQIQLPATSILTKAQLNMHFVRYWNLLNESSSVRSETVLNDDSSVGETQPTSFTQNQAFLGSGDPESFFEKVIPRTRQVFDIMRKYIQGSLSLPSVIHHLQPFLIY